MNNPIKKIALILSLVIILPAAVFTLYEINSLNESEEVLEEIYNNQLEAILFSVNQYSEDVVSSWRSSLNLLLKEAGNDQKLFKAGADSFLNINNSVITVYFTDTFDADRIYSLREGSLLEGDSYTAMDLLRDNADKIKRLFSYQKSGYSKIEPVETSGDTLSAFIFLVDDPLKHKNICIMIINPLNFVRNVLGTKMREITEIENQFIIAVSSRTNRETGAFIFSTDDLGNQQVEQRKSLWLIPGYELGILLRGKTIEALVKERSATGLILVLLLVAMLVTGVVIVFWNIRKEIELARIKSDFVSNVSHELRTPLALISMFSETLEMGRVKSEEKKQEYYSIISKEAGRLSRIVNKILSFSKIEAGRREYRFSEVNLNFLAQEIFNSYQFHLNSRNFKFSFVPDDSIPEIKADAEAVSEAVINLLDNAVKYSNDRKEIEIKTGRENNFIFIEVNDKGLGISEEHQKKIFEKFYRVSNDLVHNTKGTGLGLTLVKHIIDAHHGEIKVKSKPSEGSSFRLNFPSVNKQGKL